MFSSIMLAPLLLAAAQLPAGTATVCPKATDKALINPDMGFVYYKYSNRLWAYGINTPDSDTLDWFPGCSTVYMRVLWNDIEPEEGEYKIVRSKTFPIKPMTKDEAILQMNLLDHSFFAFKDEEAGGAFAVVYRRNDGDYGLIEDEQ